ncbi:pyruvate kinase [Aurantiacibacter gangjinensis]|uniref:Pyruvate kinase n=1 Tax=Aurantiacibacter gangjinensis TaxID=502682 RepID=A0A0G9ML42_9SPHN|nr:pyruvate kinase [Aurantiacibacter gangjinensis]APE27195.1 Pyruvate kinase [Aurantiacibacter gangjinensis]KLE31329.1 pyruvate kinase [Aurantiacibacter gangjinensis]
MTKLEPRGRKVKILATTGPATADPEVLRALFLAGADAFRVNMSHGEHDIHAKTIANIRALEAEFHRPIAILADLQGPKLRVGKFADGRATIAHGATFTFDRSDEPGDATRVQLPHPEILDVVEESQRLLVNDGKMRFRIKEKSEKGLVCVAEVGGVISDRKGVNVPDAEIPIPALTDKDKRDLAFALEQGADWIGLSFVQRPDDLAEARKLMGGRGALCAKIEKPQAVRRLGEIIEQADGIMVARGDLGVELNPEEVPPLQKKIVNQTRLTGKPVIVATQMLESMIESPAPTRAEVSDVANAVYDGADVVMLSAETAAGDWPEEAVMMMDAIAKQVEKDEDYKERVRLLDTPPDPTTADALAHACMTIGDTVSLGAIGVFTSSGSSARRVSRERPAVPVMVLTPSMEVGRRVALLWGAHPVQTKDIGSFEEMIAKGKRMALRHGFGGAGSRFAIMAGVPFGQSGATNLVHVVTIQGDELEGY